MKSMSIVVIIFTLLSLILGKNISNPFIKFLEIDTINVNPKFDYVSDYNWLSANLKDFPAFIQPTPGGINYSENNLNSLKNHLNIVENNQIELYQAYKNGIYRNYIIDLNNIDYSDCKLEDGLFYGIYNMYDNSCEKVNFGYMDEPEWQKYFDVFGFKIIDLKFRDVNNDNYMDALIFLSCLNCGTMRGATKAVLTKTDKDQKMFQIIDIIKY